MPENIISFDEWSKVDLRIGEIIGVEEIEGADKLWKLEVDLGFEKRIICAGLKQFYSEDELMNKKIIVVVNLAPRKMRGIESQGMLLAAVSGDESTPQAYTKEAREPLRGPEKSSKKIFTKGNVVLISPASEIENGAKVR